LPDVAMDVVRREAVKLEDELDADNQDCPLKTSVPV